MPSLFNARTLISPNYIEPDNIVTMAQASGFMADLGGAQLRVMLDTITKVVYQNRIDLRTSIATQQASANQLPGATITADFVQTAAYLFRTRNNYNELDVAEAGEWNVALPEAYRLAGRQGIFQALRNANLYGVNASNNEGLLNTPNSTVITLPPDSFGNTTVPTYDNGEMAIWLLAQIQAAKQRMFTLGTPDRIAIVGPQRIIGQFELQNVVQTTSYQRPGAGTASTAQMVKKVAEEFGIEIEWAYDDTLIEQGAGSTSSNPVDALLLTVPDATVPKANSVNTNIFGTLQPTQQYLTLQYADMAAPMEIVSPIAEGVDLVQMLRATSGWAPRGQAVTVMSLPY